MKNKSTQKITGLMKEYQRNLENLKRIEKKQDYYYNSLKDSGDKFMKIYERLYLKKYNNLRSISNVNERIKAFFKEYCFLEDFSFKIGYLPRDISDFKRVLELVYVDLKYNKGKLTNGLSFNQVQTILLLKRDNSYRPSKKDFSLFKKFEKDGFVISKKRSNKEYFKLSKSSFEKINYMFYLWQEERFKLVLKNNWVYKL